MQAETFYHIYNHANGNENLFRTEDNYFYFLKRYAFFLEPVADTYAYCLMPNHFHFLIRTKELVFKTSEVSKTSDVLETSNDLETSNVLKLNPYSKALADLFNSYTKSYNKKFERRGSLFNHKFKRKPVENDTYLITLVHYIHSNPVHHGFVKNIADWPYSSYHSFISKKDSLLKRDEVFEWFNGKDDFLAYHNQPIDPKIDFEFD